MSYSLVLPTGSWEEFENFFDRMVTDRYGPAPSQTARQGHEQAHQGTSAVVKANRPRMDVVETKEAVVVTVEFPGVKKEDISIDLHNGRLCIAAESKSSKDHTEGNVRVSERRFGSFTRTLTMPEGTKPEQIKAGFEDGVLRVEVPKVAPEERAAKRITIA